MSIKLFTYISHRVPFDWAFVQCGPEQFSEAQYRSFLTSAIFDDPMPFFEAKVALNLIAHRLVSQQECLSIGSGVLLLVADIMQAGRHALHPDDFGRLKEHLFEMPQINALFTSSTISADILEQGIESIAYRITYFDIFCFGLAGIHPILDATVDATNVFDRNVLLPFSAHWAERSLSASCLPALAQV
jgi:hypothetical protein